MRTLTSILAVMLLALAAPGSVQAKIALNRAIVVNVHVPGSEEGMKHGAVTLVRLLAGAKKGETITTPLTEHTQLTRLSEKEREKITLKDLRPGMVAVIEIYGNRRGEKEPWYLGMLHVLGPLEDVDPALAKILGPFDINFAATVTGVGPPSPERKDDLGQVEAKWAGMAYIFRVTKRTEIVWQAGDGKRTPATLDDIKTVHSGGIWISWFGPLAAGDPPVVPATRIILDLGSKKRTEEKNRR